MLRREERKGNHISVTAYFVEEVALPDEIPRNYRAQLKGGPQVA